MHIGTIFNISIQNSFSDDSADTNTFLKRCSDTLIKTSVAEPHHFYAAPAPGKNFDAAPAPAPTLLYSKAKFLKRTKV
jgi:hypothetical protein